MHIPIIRMRPTEYELRKPYDAFCSTMDTLPRYKKEKASSWTRAPNLAEQNNLCLICGIDLLSLPSSKRYTTSIVPIAIGGPRSYQNTIVLCSTCGKNRGTCDITDPSFRSRLVAPLPAALLKKRTNLLLNGENHLTPLGPKVAQEKLAAELLKRYEHPRFCLHVHASALGFFVAFRKQQSNPQSYAGAVVMLRHVFKMELEERGNLVVLRGEPDKALDALWALIEINALLLAVDLFNLPCDMSHTLDWRCVWRETYDRLSDNRRRYRRGQRRQPWKPQALSMTAASVKRRKAENYEQKTFNRARVECEHAEELYARWLQWSDPKDAGYWLRPTDAEIKWTLDASIYWRLSEHERVVFCHARPDFIPPSPL